MKSLLLMGLLCAPALALAPAAPANAADEKAPKRVWIEASLAYNGGDPIKFTNPIPSGGRFEVKALDVPVRIMLESICGDGLCEETWKEQEVGQKLVISPKILSDEKVEVRTEFTDRWADPNITVFDKGPMGLASQVETNVLTTGKKETLVVLDPRGKGAKPVSGAKLELTVKVEE